MSERTVLRLSIVAALGGTLAAVAALVGYRLIHDPYYRT